MSGTILCGLFYFMIYAVKNLKRKSIELTSSPTIMQQADAGANPYPANVEYRVSS